MIKPYKYIPLAIRNVSDHDNNVLLEGFVEVCKALAVISHQLAEGTKEQSRLLTHINDLIDD